MTIKEKAKEYADANYPKIGMNDDWIDDGFDEGYNAAGNGVAENAYIAGVKEATRWIPIDESLPKVDKDVLVKGYCEEGGGTYYDVGYLHTGSSHIFITGSVWTVTHWRPIEFE